jgi:hypothetical protein
MALNGATDYADKIKEDIAGFYKGVETIFKQMNTEEIVTHKKSVLAKDISSKPALYHSSSLGKPKMVSTYASLDDLNIVDKAISILEFRYPADGEDIIIKIK